MTFESVYTASKIEKLKNETNSNEEENNNDNDFKNTKPNCPEELAWPAVSAKTTPEITCIFKVRE
jgi:hypothetical protein